MKIVESLTTSHKDNRKVLRRVNAFVVRLGSQEMSQAIHTPGCIQSNHVTECKANHECIQEALIPKIPGHKYRHYHIKQQGEKLVVSGIEKKIQMLFFLEFRKLFPCIHCVFILRQGICDCHTLVRKCWNQDCLTSESHLS